MFKPVSGFIQSSWGERGHINNQVRFCRHFRISPSRWRTLTDQKNKLESVAEMLENASKILRGEASTSDSNQQGTSSVQRALENARAMIRNSTSSGTFRRLNRTERLRATAPYTDKKPQPKKVTKKKKAVEFALLKCFGESNDEELEDEHHLKWDSIIANGMIMLDEEDDEECIRKAIKNSVASKFPIIRANDFEFVKVRQKKITKLELGPGTQYDYSVVKKMAGQGLLYVKIKEGFECLYEDSDDTTLSTSKVDNDALHNKDENDEILSYEIPDNMTDSPAEVNPFDCVINEITEKDLTDPVEILKFLQQRLIKGRKLDVATAAFDIPPDPEDSQNATNYISVDRGHNNYIFF